MAIMSSVRAKFPLPANFRAFLQNIRPSKERRDAAKKYPDIVRDFLERSDLLKTSHPHSRLTGSYGRRIAIHEIKDVDFVVFVDEEYATLGAMAALTDLETALNALAVQLGEDGERPLVELRAQRRSVRVCFTKPDFYLDIVPARAPDGTDATSLLVPDREWKNWQPTACVAYGGHFTNLNQDECERLLVPLMKTLKHWRTRWLKRNQAKSFWLEAMVVNLVERGEITFAEKSLTEVVADAFRAIRDECQPSLDRVDATPVIPDPMIPDENPNVAFNWKRSDFETFMRRIDEACDLVDDAIDAGTAQDAITAWQDLLGEEWFPAEIEEESDAAKAAAFGEEISVSKTGAVVIGTAPTIVPLVHPRPNTFHGDDE